MPTDNRNRFLDAGDSDDDLGRADDSDDDLQKGGRNAKRRRVDDDESDPEGPSDDEQDQSDADLSDHDGGAALDKGDDPADTDADTGDQTDREKAPKAKSSRKPELPGVTKNLVKPNLVVSDAAIKKSGVVYLSRVPPYMNPHKLRSLLEPYGKINRLFLAPEDPTARTRRIKGGGNKKRFFTEGWVEFLRKKDAKKACELLNVGDKEPPPVPQPLTQLLGTGPNHRWEKGNILPGRHLEFAVPVWLQVAQLDGADLGGECRALEQDARRDHQVDQGEQRVRSQH